MPREERGTKNQSRHSRSHFTKNRVNDTQKCRDSRYLFPGQLMKAEWWKKRAEERDDHTRETFFFSLLFCIDLIATMMTARAEKSTRHTWTAYVVVRKLVSSRLLFFHSVVVSLPFYHGHSAHAIFVTKIPIRIGENKRTHMQRLGNYSFDFDWVYSFVSLRFANKFEFRRQTHTHKHSQAIQCKFSHLSLEVCVWVIITIRYILVHSFHFIFVQFDGYVWVCVCALTDHTYKSNRIYRNRGRCRVCVRTSHIRPFAVRE